MFDKLHNFFAKTMDLIVPIMFGLLIAFLVVYMIVINKTHFDSTTKTIDIGAQDYKDGIQKHLVWSIKGECFFVLPTNGTNINLIPVKDCDKK